MVFRVRGNGERGRMRLLLIPGWEGRHGEAIKVSFMVLLSKDLRFTWIIAQDVSVRHSYSRVGTKWFYYDISYA